MLFLFVPYYNEPIKKFLESVENSTIKFSGDTHSNRLIYRDRKRAGIYWTKAVNDFYNYVSKCRGIKDSDIIGIMNSDISFGSDLIEEGMKVKQGEVYISQGIQIDWRKKKFFEGNRIDTFPGRCFFMTYKDFINSGGFSKLLPHYLSDYDFGIKMCKRLKPIQMESEVYHEPHIKNKEMFSILNPVNPIFFTIFLLKHFNRYTLLNILKAWYDGIFRH